MSNEYYLIVMKMKFFIVFIILFFYSIDIYAQSEQSSSIIKSINDLQNSTILDSIPKDFPPIQTYSIINPAQGKLFLANIGQAYPGFLMILNDDGTPVAFKRISQQVYNFKVQPNGLLSYGFPKAIYTGSGFGNCTWFIADSNFSIIDSLKCGNGFITDFHDFQLLPNGHTLFISYETIHSDLSSIIQNGSPNANIMNCLIQELDASKNVVFQWSAIDHKPITDSYEDLEQNTIDPFHINSVEQDFDGNFIISCRHSSEIIKIDRATGKIIWRLGGKSNQFTFINENQDQAPTFFSYQHDARRVSDKNITLFDNGTQHSPEHSRAVEYKLDEANKTAELAWEYRHSNPDIFSQNMGGVERFPNGNSLISWGGANSGMPSITEVHPDNSIALELMMQSGPSNPSQVYKAYRYPWKSGLISASITRDKIHQDIDYDFNDLQDSSGVHITFKELQPIDSGVTQVTVGRYEWAPLKPEFDKPAPIISQNRIVITKSAIASFIAEIHFNLTKLQKIYNPEKYVVYSKEHEGSGKFIQIPTIYNSGTKELIVTVSKFGEFIFGIPYQAQKPAKPILISPVDKDIVNQNADSIICRWNPEGYFTDSEIIISTDTDFQNIVLDSILKINNISINPKQNQEYFWKVRSENEAGEGEWSQVWSFKTVAPFIQITYPDGGETLFKDSTYVIRWSKNIIEPLKIELLKNDILNVTLADSILSYTGAYEWQISNNLPDGSDYKIRITSLTEPISTESKKYFTIRNSNTDVKPEITNNIDIKCYPNPTNMEANIEFELLNPGFITLKIYDIYGNKIENLYEGFLVSGNHQIIWLSTSHQSGIYFCKLQTETNTYISRLILIK